MTLVLVLVQLIASNHLRFPKPQVKILQDLTNWNTSCSREMRWFRRGAMEPRPRCLLCSATKHEVSLLYLLVVRDPNSFFFFLNPIHSLEACKSKRSYWIHTLTIQYKNESRSVWASSPVPLPRGCQPGREVARVTVASVSHPALNSALLGGSGRLPEVCSLASWEWLQKTSLTCGSGSRTNFQT